MGTESPKSKSSSKSSNSKPQQPRSATGGVSKATGGVSKATGGAGKGVNNTVKKAGSASDKAQESAKKQQANNVMDEGARRKESAKLSKKSLEYKKKAKDLFAAANAAGDPDERQKLMEEAINYQIEAETFGKTAKYLQSGTFQGMAVGAGLGSVPGLTIGTLVGTLVGGVLVLVVGGLSGLIGAGVGALNGPFWNIGKLAGKGIRKITGDFPGWKATAEQKRQLEKMCGQVNEQDVSEAELSGMANWDEAGGDGANQTWTQYAVSFLPSILDQKGGHSILDSKAGQEKAQQLNQATSQKQPPTASSDGRESGGSQASKTSAPTSSQPSQTGGEQTRRKPRKLGQPENAQSNRPARKSSMQ